MIIASKVFKNLFSRNGALKCSGLLGLVRAKIFGQNRGEPLSVTSRFNGFYVTTKDRNLKLANLKNSE